jgi:hypothetical protein
MNMVWHNHITPDQPFIGLAPGSGKQGDDFWIAENVATLRGANGDEYDYRMIVENDRRMSRISPLRWH